MITHTSGNILEDDADALVNPVNCVGVMGRGLALQFKSAYPTNFESYKRAADRNRIRIGINHVHALPPDHDRFIINFPTKRHWKHPSHPHYIQLGLQDLHMTIPGLGIQSIAIPPLGCGLGGLDWSEIRPLIESELDDLPIDIRLYAPQETP